MGKEELITARIMRKTLESGIPVFCDGAAVLPAVLVVKDLVVNGVSTLLEVDHDTVVCRNAVEVI